MSSLPLRGARCVLCCALRPARGIFGPHLRGLRSISRSTGAVRRLPTYAAQSTPFEVEVLPGPSSGTYSFRRIMSEQEARRSPFIIGVAGGTASGKTSVCTKIIADLRQDKELDLQEGSVHRFLHIAQDNFYRDLTLEEQAHSFNFDHPTAFAWSEIVATLQDLKEGKPASIPQYDFVTSSRKAQSTSVESADVILFDGILAFYNAELRSLYDLMIFVNVDDDTRLARRVRRDITERGRDVLQVLDQYERTVKPSFTQFILPTKQYAHIIIPRGLDNNVAIDLITQHIKWRLSERVQSRSNAGRSL